MSVTLLHLSDIHAGPGELRDEDLKRHVPGAERQNMLERLTKYLKSLPSQPDYVIITGDLTTHGVKEGIIDFATWIEKNISEKNLPETDRIIVVPGNHDVQSGIEEKTGWHKQRYNDFFETIAKVFPHAYLPNCDPPLNHNNPKINSDPDKVIGGLTTRSRFGRVEIVNSFPFLLDLERDILIFAFNSTLCCGVFMPSSPEIIEPLDSLITLYKDNKELHPKLNQIRSSYQKSLLIDAGLVGDEQLEYFSQLMARLKKELGKKYSHLTKIAALHHHVSHLWRQQLEVKEFESVLDAAQLKQRLIEYEFDLVLHGHKHLNHVALDGSIIPISSTKQFSPLCISSGGTIGGYPRLGDRQTFKFIVFEEEIGPRTMATITEVPLLDSADPRSTISMESKVCPVPISARLPELHYLPSIKNLFDDFMINKFAPEISASENLVMSGAKSKFPTTTPELVNGTWRYNFHSIIDSTNEMVFYDIILATKRLGFGHHSRIYWMLSMVTGLNKYQNKKHRVVVLLGNFEKTHFFIGAIRGEIVESVKEIRKWFAPAVQTGLLEIRHHSFSQVEVDKLSRLSV